MSEFQVRSDNVDVEQIMRQIRARIREKRGVDYTEEEVRELANVKLEKFLDPRGVRSDLLEQYRRRRSAEPAPPNYKFEDSTIYETHRGLLRAIRRLLNPLLKLFFNPAPIAEALHVQAQLNQRQAQREELDTLHYELIHNLVLELTRTSIEVKNLKMRLESISSRLDFDERRARALEGVVQYRPGAATPMQPPQGGGPSPSNDLDNEGNERRSRRRRRRGRRRPGDERGPRGDEREADERETGGTEIGEQAAAEPAGASAQGDSSEPRRSEPEPRPLNPEPRTTSDS
jgi:hypothetical protein